MYGSRSAGLDIRNWLIWLFIVFKRKYGSHQNLSLVFGGGGGGWGVNTRGGGNNTGADQSVHLGSLISPFVIRFLESCIM